MLSSEYKDNPRMSQSRLRWILEGPEEFKYRLDNPTESTEPKDLGSAVHILLFQPNLCDRIIKFEKPASNTREGKIFKAMSEGKHFMVTKASRKKTHENYMEIDEDEHGYVESLKENYGEFLSNPDKFLPLKTDQYDAAHRIAEAIRQNDDCRGLLEQCTHFEKINLYTYKGIDFKSQFDGLGENFILDLKTSATVTNDDWDVRQTIRKHFYHFQSASYVLGLAGEDFYDNPAEAFNSINYYVFFARTKPPYSIYPRQMSYGLWEEGLLKFENACDLYNDCLKFNPEFKPQNKMRLV